MYWTDLNRLNGAERYQIAPEAIETKKHGGSLLENINAKLFGSVSSLMQNTWSSSSSEEQCRTLAKAAIQ